MQDSEEIPSAENLKDAIENYNPDGYSAGITAKRTLAVFLTYGYNIHGKKQYIYYAVEGTKLDEMKKVMHSPKFDIAKIGTVLKWGYGDPPQEVMQEMEDKYGFRHQSSLLLPRD